MNREAYAAQVVDPAAGARALPESGLDPEEAAIISKSYRKSLTTEKEKQSDQKMDNILILQKPDDSKRSADK